jgi:hypothetical protein
MRFSHAESAPRLCIRASVNEKKTTHPSTPKGPARRRQKMACFKGFYRTEKTCSKNTSITFLKKYTFQTATSITLLQNHSFFRPQRQALRSYKTTPPPRKKATSRTPTLPTASSTKTHGKTKLQSPQKPTTHAPGHHHPPHSSNKPTHHPVHNPP